MHPAGRAERRRLMRLTVKRWKTFLLNLHNGHSWKPFRGFAADELHLFASRLASRHITWQELTKPWKAVLRRRRKQQEAERLRIDLESEGK